MTLDTILPGATTTLSCTVLHLKCPIFTFFSRLLTPHVGVIFGVAIIIVVQYARSPWRKVPPGPEGLPILGNAFQLKDKRWMFTKDCKQKFENILYLNALGQPIIILNSLKAAADLLDKRASIYSDRPRLIVAREIFCGGLFIALMPYGDLWRRTRRAAHEVLTKAIVRDYQPIFFKEAILLALSIIENSNDLDKHAARASASATMSILYDYPTLEDGNDKMLTDILAFNDRMTVACAPGAYLVELFPWMVHIPERFARWKREGLEYFRQNTAMFNRPLNSIYDDIAQESERPSVGASLIKNSDRSELSRDEIAWLLGALYSAGAETTATTIMWWVLAMIANPDIQRRAQDQLDVVVGRSRLPTFADVPSLPYIQAMVKESLRWRPALPLGLPHSTIEDDWYEGMFVPKGTLCLANLWQCNLDPSFYGDDAVNFNPERFLDEQGRLTPGPAETRDDGHSTYGFGRRACAGKHAANDSLLISMATVLWAVKLERPRDKSGKEIPLDTETPVDIGMVFRPAPYRCNAIPRFPEALSLLAEEFESMRT